MVVRTIESAGAVARAIATQVPDVILLSDQFAHGRLQSSSVDMLTLLQQSAPRVPVIMLGTRADSMERIICLECGADDYVDMPCHPRELLSRIRNILRYRPRAARSLIDRDGDCAFGDFVFNRSRLHLTKHGVSVALQESAMALLGKLTENPMKVLSRQALIEMVTGVSAGTSAEASVGVNSGLTSRGGVSVRSAANGGEHRRTARGVTGAVSPPRGGVSCERSLDVVVCRLRRVIESNPSQPKFLQTVRGFGYVFNPSGAGASVHSPEGSDTQSHKHSMLPMQQAHQDGLRQGAIQKPVRRAVASADTTRTINPWFSEISFPTRYPASEDLASRSPA